MEVWSNDRPQKVTTQPWEETGAIASALGKQTGPGSAESLPEDWAGRQQAGREGGRACEAVGVDQHALPRAAVPPGDGPFLSQHVLRRVDIAYALTLSSEESAASRGRGPGPLVHSCVHCKWQRQAQKGPALGSGLERTLPMAGLSSAVFPPFSHLSFICPPQAPSSRGQGQEDSPWLGSRRKQWACAGLPLPRTPCRLKPWLHLG